MFDEIRRLEQEKIYGPSPDMVKCSDCGGLFYIDNCPMEQDGSWEYGYYDVPTCPNCEDGGCCDDFHFSPEQWELYEEWERKNSNVD